MAWIFCVWYNKLGIFGWYPQLLQHQTIVSMIIPWSLPGVLWVSLSSHEVSYGVCMHVTFVCGELGFLVSDLSHTIRFCVPLPHHRHMSPPPPPRENLMVGPDYQ
jgi:hypothetical protein